MDVALFIILLSDLVKRSARLVRLGIDIWQAGSVRVPIDHLHDLGGVPIHGRRLQDDSSITVGCFSVRHLVGSARNDLRAVSRKMQEAFEQYFVAVSPMDAWETVLASLRS